MFLAKALQLADKLNMYKCATFYGQFGLEVWMNCPSLDMSRTPKSPEEIILRHICSIEEKLRK